MNKKTILRVEGFMMLLLATFLPLKIGAQSVYQLSLLTMYCLRIMFVRFNRTSMVTFGLLPLRDWRAMMAIKLRC